MPPATGTHTGVWHPAGNEQGPAATTGERVRETALRIQRRLPGPAGSTSHGATGAARPERSLQAGGFASGMEARQGGDSSAGSVHDSPARGRESHKQERNGKKRKKKNSNHRNITSGSFHFPDITNGKGNGRRASVAVTLQRSFQPAGEIRTRADRRPPPPAPVSPVSAAL